MAKNNELRTRGEGMELFIRCITAWHTILANDYGRNDAPVYRDCTGVSRYKLHRTVHDT